MEAPHPSRRGLPLGLKVAMGVLAIPVFLALFLLGQSKTVEAQAWPVIRRIALRLQTDDGAAGLYRANPALARTYPTEDAFLDQVRAHRTSFASLPDLPPKADRFECHAGPNGFRASVQGSDESWATFEVRQNILFEKVPGEGVLRLEFSPTKEPNARERRAQRRAEASLDWQRYRDICALLASEDGTRSLWRREPGLHAAFPREDGLLSFAAATRPHLHPLPDSDRLSQVRLLRQVRDHTVRLGYPFQAGTLTAVWIEGRLTGLEFTPR
jgi:hypothetical protein